VVAEAQDGMRRKRIAKASRQSRAKKTALARWEKLIAARFHCRQHTRDLFRGSISFAVAKRQTKWVPGACLVANCLLFEFPLGADNGVGGEVRAKNSILCGFSQPFKNSMGPRRSSPVVRHYNLALSNLNYRVNSGFLGLLNFSAFGIG
jgi:hypothetical protein